MKYRALFAWMLFLGTCGTLATAGEYNPVLDIGDQAPAWGKLPGTDGRQYALQDFQDKEVLVVVFTCNSCPYAVDYEDRLVAFAKAHAGAGDPVGLVAINVNRIEEDQLPAMKERAAAKGFPFPYLYDESQKVAKDFGATRTPEFFVLDKQRKVIYMGAMDDSSDAAKVTKAYLEDAVSAALRQGMPPVQETVAIGCNIRYVRSRSREK